MRPRRWLFSALQWDGALPLFVAAVSLTVAAAFPRNDVAEITVVILFPIVAALVRAAKARDQLAAISGGYPSLMRQAALGIAIVLLLWFEISFGVLARAQPPWGAWWPAPILYMAYLALILVALRPGRMVIN
jgi:hypothetical protein